MSRVVLNGDLQEKLSRLYYPVEVCDQSGRVIGHFVPSIDPSDLEPLTPEISREELDRRKRSKGKTYTTAEVLAYLEKLG